MELILVYIKVTIGILAIVNPAGAIPVFLALTGDLAEAERKRIARRSAITLGVTLLVGAWIGQFILSFFGISIPAFRVGGGILILLMAISMLHAQPTGTKHSEEEQAEAMQKDDIAIVPIGIPILAGPGSISLVIVSVERAENLLGVGLLSIGIVVVALLSWIALALAEWFGKKLGRTGLNVATRLEGLILAAIAVEFIADGMRELFPGLAAVATGAAT